VKVVLLCGGRGTRLREQTEALPKPLIEIGGRPILWHVMKYYAHFGFTDFVLCLGYLGDRIKQYFAGDRAWERHDFVLHSGASGPKRIELLGEREDWNITFVDTGLETNTGGRVKRAERYLDDDLFLVTYADGLADLDLSQLVDFHRSHGRLASLTTVNPASPFGVLDLGADGKVRRFQEKPRLDGWINGGFFVFSTSVLGRLGPNDNLEQDLLTALAEEDELYAFRHTGFWACMDTYKDHLALNALWESGEAPWRVWER
jgi:glucose-1-phosphate cytidylyltransferase